jgi:hypothetical protein
VKRIEKLSKLNKTEKKASKDRERLQSFIKQKKKLSKLQK